MMAGDSHNSHSSGWPQRSIHDRDFDKRLRSKTSFSEYNLLPSFVVHIRDILAGFIHAVFKQFL